MRVLIVEDDENKRIQIATFISGLEASATVEHASSYQSGLRKILSDRFDLVLLDMTLPTFDVAAEEKGGRPQAYGGRELLRQMHRRRIVMPVIVITQFDKFGEATDALTLQELDKELAESHPETYQGMVYYNATLEGWKEELTARMGLRS